MVYKTYAHCKHELCFQSLFYFSSFFKENEMARKPRLRRYFQYTSKEEWHLSWI